MATKEPIPRLPWMYTLISGATIPYPVFWECPLCFAVVRQIKKHTAYHESKGESDGD